MCRMLPALLGLIVAAAIGPVPAAAQGWPDDTGSLAGGRVTFGGEVTATVAPDDRGRFNYTDYERSALRLVRLGFTAAVRPVDRVALIAEVRAEGDTGGGAWSAIPTALYVRVRPWRDFPFDLQAGRIPPVFGVAGRHVYATDNVLIGYPLAWQYLTVLRANALPASADELLYARRSGWKPGYSVGADGYARGVPLATAFRYDTGVEARLGEETRPVSVALAVTAGTISSPGVRDTNGGPQFSTRVAVRPVVGLILGASYADGRFIAETVRNSLPVSLRGRRYSQRTFGADAEYSAGHFLARTELVSARWTLPVTGSPAIANPLVATGLSVEGRYRVAPGVTVGARVDHLGFSDQPGTYAYLPWDATVSRVEGGIAWRVTRHVVLRGTLQHDSRTRGAVKAATLPAAQVTVWF
jgi:hypothetical protein